MDIDPEKLTQWGAIVASIAGGYYAIRTEVAHLKEKVADNSKELKETRDLALKAHGADDTINARISALEGSVRELKESQEAHAERVEGALEKTARLMQDTVNGFANKFSGAVQRLERRISDLDKNKISNDRLPAVQTGQHPVFVSPGDRVTPRHGRRDSRHDDRRDPESDDDPENEGS